MPLIEDRIKIGRCYGMTIGGKLIVARVIQIYPLDIGVRKNPVKENVVRWAWRDAAGSGKWTESPGWLSPLRRTTKWPATASILSSREG
jgi:hypothetical protein